MFHFSAHIKAIYDLYLHLLSERPTALTHYYCTYLTAPYLWNALHSLVRSNFTVMNFCKIPFLDSIKKNKKIAVCSFTSRGCCCPQFASLVFTDVERTVLTARIWLAVWNVWIKTVGPASVTQISIHVSAYFYVHISHKLFSRATFIEKTPNWFLTI